VKTWADNNAVRGIAINLIAYRNSSNIICGFQAAIFVMGACVTGQSIRVLVGYNIQALQAEVYRINTEQAEGRLF
jgi:hypothetical protein